MTSPNYFERAIYSVGALCLLLIVPVLCFQNWQPGFQSPGARSGDEPHYLVMAHSLARDLDLDIANNYSPIRFAEGEQIAAEDRRQPNDEAQSATAGYPQGVYLTGVPLSRHTNLVPSATSPLKATRATPAGSGGPAKIYRWDEVYEFAPAPGVDPTGATDARAAAGARLNYAERFIAQRRPEFADFACADCREVAWHPPGYPVLLAVVAYPFLAVGSYWSEFWITLLQIALYSFALLRVREVVPLRPVESPASGSRVGNAGRSRDFFYLAATATALSAYYFAASIYTEGVTPALLLLAVCAFARRRPLEISAYLGVLFFIKESYAPLGPIFACAYWLEHRRLRDLFVMAVFPLIAFALFLTRNYVFYGSALQTYYPWASNPEPLAGALGLMFAARKGVLVFTPVFVFFLAGLWPLARKRPAVALVSGCTFAYFYLLTSATAYWSGGPTYGYRLLTPAVAVLTPAFFAWLAMLRAARATMPVRVARVLTLVLLAVSTVNGFFGATNLDYAYDTETYINLIEPEQSQIYRRFLRWSESAP
ncbi:MAG: hypothetical protein RIF32_09610 [Leptospirales bacterium]|jgi:hypothetical protein